MAKDVTEKLKSKMDKTGGDTPPVSPSVPNHIKHYQSEQRSIVRQSCLKAAIQIVVATNVVETNINVKEAMRIAEEFEAWVHRD